MEIVTLNRDTFKNYMGEFADLYTLCFNVPMTHKEVKWRYLDNPNKDILSCIALDKGKLVANYSTSPIRLVKNGEIIKAALSLNTMTHPDYMGQGLFVKLASMVYSNMQRDNYKLVMGFPNNISHRTFITKLNWKDISIVPTLELAVNKAKMKSLQIQCQIVSDQMYSLDYSKCMHNDHCIYVHKDNEYLKWRYRDNPAMQYYNYAIIDKNNPAYASSRVILKEYKNRLNIVDSFFSSEEEEKALLNHTIKLAKTMGKELITCWFKLDTQEHLVLESYGFCLASPIAYFGTNILNQGHGDNEYLNEYNWYLNLSDDNVY